MASTEDVNFSSGPPLRKTLLIVVTYNSYDLLPNLIGSIRDFLNAHEGNHVVVIENSADRRVYDMIDAEVNSHRVVVEVASRNEGFSPGVNLGYKVAQERWGSFDFIILLNPDVLSAGHIVAELVDRASATPDCGVGIWSVILRDQRGNIDGGCARRQWNRRRFFAHLLGYDRFSKLLCTAPLGLTEREIIHDQHDLAMVSGALMCIRAEVFGRGLAVRVPLYLEDQEIGMRCLAMGYALRIYPDLEAVHIGGVSRESAPEYKRALKVMGYAEAPIECMSKFGGYKLSSLRLTVFMGGAARSAAAPFVAALKVLSRRGGLRYESAWAAGQLKLGYWLAFWAIHGKLHDEDVSLSDYLREYAQADTERR